MAVYMIEFNVKVLVVCLCLLIAFMEKYTHADDLSGRVGACTVQVISQQTVQFDGKAYPQSFRLECPSKSASDVGGVLFILVKPGTTNLEGVPLRVEQPFYIAADVLSIGQALSFLNDANHEEYVKAQMEKWGEVARELGNLPVFSSYVNNTQYPYFIQDLPELFRLSQAVSRRTGVLVRVPTLAEWTLAMQGGSRTRFWWGEDWPPPLGTVIPAPDQIWYDGETWEKLEKVESGKPNPFGLYHMIGNVSSLVFPSEVERQELLKHLRPGGAGWKKKKVSIEGSGIAFNPDCWKKRYTIGPYTFLTLGGSAFESGRSAEKRTTSLSRAVRYTFTLPIPSHPFTAMPVGMRLVMPLASAERIGVMTSTH